MPEWRWEIYEDNNLDMPIAAGRVRNGLAKSPHEILAEMIAVNAGARWTYVDSVEVQPYEHDGMQKSVHHLSDGTRLRAELSPVT